MVTYERTGKWNILWPYQNMKINDCLNSYFLLLIYYEEKNIIKYDIEMHLVPMEMSISKNMLQLLLV